MKKEFLFWIGLSCGSLFVLWKAFYFYDTQESHYIQLTTNKNQTQNTLTLLKKDLEFLRNNQKEINFLIEKGWFTPKNRLIAGETLEKLCRSLNEIQYTFEPENIKNIEGNHTFKITKLVIEGGALLESDFYACIDVLLEKFTGILRPCEISLSRGEEVNEKSLFALMENHPPNFVRGKLVFEWFAIGVEEHEK